MAIERPELVVLVLRGVRAVDPSQKLDAVVDIVVEDGRITRLGRDAARDFVAPATAIVRTATPAAPLWIFPGFVDLHAHLREPGQESKEDVQSGLAAAAAGGFTDVCCMPNTRPVNDSKLVTELLLRKARDVSHVRLHPIGAITVGQMGTDLTEMATLKEAGVVAVSDDGKCVTSSAVMRSALEYAATFDLPVIQHAEDHALTEGAQMHEGSVSTRLGLRGWPRVAEDVIVARDVILAEYTRAKYHVAHLSTVGAARIVREAKSRGIPVTAEVTPHHLLLTHEAVLGYRTACKVNPPLREDEDVEAMRAALADGTIDCVATDHAPHSPRRQGRAVRRCPARHDRARAVRAAASWPGRERRAAARSTRRFAHAGAGEGGRDHAAAAERRSARGLRHRRSFVQMDNRSRAFRRQITEYAVRRSPSERSDRDDGFGRKDRVRSRRANDAGGDGMSDTQHAHLVLADGMVFTGRTIGARGIAVGEAVFTTTMMGYEEVLTDPSYSGQLVTMTAPEIGNVGINADDSEARDEKPRAAGLICRQASPIASSWRSTSTLQEWLAASNVTGIEGVDTRKLTRHLRDHGSQNAAIGGPEVSVAELLEKAKRAPDMNGLDLVATIAPARAVQMDRRSRRVGAGGLQAARRNEEERRRHRLRHQAQHPALPGRRRVRRDLRAAEHVGRGHPRDEARRCIFVQRPG